MGNTRCLLTLLFMINTVLAQSNNQNSCINPNNENGICLNIKQCPALLSILQNNRKNNTAIAFLRSSMCGNEGRDPKVCCPRNPVSFGGSVTSSKLPSQSTCGVSYGNVNKIVGGWPAELDDWPWMVALGYHGLNQPKTETPQWRCGGSLISDRYVVTAAHCLVKIGPVEVSVARLGELDLDPNTDDKAEPIDIPIQKIITHQSYNSKTHANDIALLKLDHSVQFNKHIQPICLPITPTIRANKFVKYVPFIAGWGTTAFYGPTSTALMSAAVPIIDNARCNRSYTGHSAVIDDSVLCAGTGEADSCQGDSGGPMMWPNGKQYYLLGVVSFGFRCAEPEFPGVYTRVSHFIEWIIENMNNS
ncbi:venom protease-like isoform X3 [Daktulosphaira vitifoliae]|nr:venom protease-like isoform X3 [Daktulosphaira vitifoliae]XP_050544589.1 venom protease-like isoform X3 [Daktulosphaira vitifoliae]